MSGICVKMNGDKCAMDFCDFWNHAELCCSSALESRKRVELLDMILEKAQKLLCKVQDEKELERVIKELNIVNVSNTIQ